MGAPPCRAHSFRLHLLTLGYRLRCHSQRPAGQCHLSSLQVVQPGVEAKLPQKYTCFSLYLGNKFLRVSHWQSMWFQFFHRTKTPDRRPFCGARGCLHGSHLQIDLHICGLFIKKKKLQETWIPFKLILHMGLTLGSIGCLKIPGVKSST